MAQPSPAMPRDSQPVDSHTSERTRERSNRLLAETLIELFLEVTHLLCCL